MCFYFFFWSLDEVNKIEIHGWDLLSFLVANDEQKCLFTVEYQSDDQQQWRKSTCTATTLRFVICHSTSWCFIISTSTFSTWCTGTTPVRGKWTSDDLWPSFFSPPRSNAKTRREKVFVLLCRCSTLKNGQRKKESERKMIVMINSRSQVFVLLLSSSFDRRTRWTCDGLFLSLPRC